MAIDGHVERVVSAHCFATHRALPMSYTLCAWQRVVLIELIQEAHGSTLSEAEFVEALSLLLEDVSGFEHAELSDLSMLIGVNPLIWTIAGELD